MPTGGERLRKRRHKGENRGVFIGCMLGGEAVQSVGSQRCRGVRPAEEMGGGVGIATGRGTEPGRTSKDCVAEPRLAFRHQSEPRGRVIVSLGLG